MTAFVRFSHSLFVPNSGKSDPMRPFRPDGHFATIQSLFHGSRWNSMRTETRLLFGPIAAATFVFIGIALSSLLPAYSHTQQSISAIGKIGSPERVPFAAVLGASHRGF
jgi:hypothetical protein